MPFPIDFYQSSYTSDSTGHISGCLTMYIWSLARLYISWLWCQVHKAWVSFLTYIPSTCSIIIKMEQTGWMMTNFHVQYLRSLGYSGLAGQCEATVCETIAFQLSYIDLNKNGRKRLDRWYFSRKEKLTIIHNIFRSDMFNCINSVNDILINTSILIKDELQSLPNWNLDNVILKP